MKGYLFFLLLLFPLGLAGQVDQETVPASEAPAFADNLAIISSFAADSATVADTLKVPNVFSPNEDNINDFFKVKTNGINIYSFSVYTRSGTLVYKTESPAIIWDGRSLSGQKMKNGIYFYIIRQVGAVPLNEVKGIVYLFE